MIIPFTLPSTDAMVPSNFTELHGSPFLLVRLACCLLSLPRSQAVVPTTKPGFRIMPLVLTVMARHPEGRW